MTSYDTKNNSTAGVTTEDICTGISNSDKESSYSSKSCTSSDGINISTTFDEKTKNKVGTADTPPTDAPVVRRR
jgi:hypothetical protein